MKSQIFAITIFLLYSCNDNSNTTIDASCIVGKHYNFSKKIINNEYIFQETELTIRRDGPGDYKYFISTTTFDEYNSITPKRINSSGHLAREIVAGNKWKFVDGELGQDAGYIKIPADNWIKKPNDILVEFEQQRNSLVFKNSELTSQLNILSNDLISFSQNNNYDRPRNFNYNSTLSDKIKSGERFTPLYNQTEIYTDDGDIYFIDTSDIIKASGVVTGESARKFGPWLRCDYDKIKIPYNHFFYIKLNKVKSIEKIERQKEEEIWQKQSDQYSSEKRKEILLVILVITTTTFIIYYLSTYCPNCKSVFTRIKVAKKATDYIDHKTTTYERSEVYDKYNKHIGHIKTPRQVDVTTFYYDIHYKCKKCGHVWIKKTQETY